MLERAEFPRRPWRGSAHGHRGQRGRGHGMQAYHGTPFGLDHEFRVCRRPIRQMHDEENEPIECRRPENLRKGTQT